MKKYIVSLQLLKRWVHDSNFEYIVEIDSIDPETAEKEARKKAFNEYPAYFTHSMNNISIKN